jgi:putative spermidine/putrescine transport system permease protein
MWLKVFVGIVVIALIAPILVVIPISFSSVSFFEFPPPGYSTTWYKSFADNQNWVDAMMRSLRIAFFTAILSTVLGTMAAMAMTRLHFFGKKLFMSLMVAPVIVPVIIVGLALYHSFSPLKLLNNETGLVIAHSVLAIPLVFVTVIAGLKGIDRNLELAAMGLGSTPGGAFFKVTLPQIRPALLSGALFAFITSLDELVVTIFLSGSRTKTLPILMWENLRTQVDPTVAVVSTILIAVTVALFLLQAWLSSRASKRRQSAG